MADYRSIAVQMAKKHGLDPHIFLRQIGAESNFNPNAVSPAGAIGIAQIMPATARGWNVNPHDPVASLNVAAKNMAAYVRKYGGYRNALIAYNAGPGAIGKPLPGETQAYIAKILKGADPKVPMPSSGGTRTTRTTTIPGVDNSGLRRSLIADFVGQGGPDNDSALISLAAGLQNAKDTPSRKITRTSSSSSGPAPTGPGGSGAFHITGANPGRLTKPLVSFARKVAGVYGRPLTGDSGATHSKYTVDGNVSDHWSGNATDIPARGKTLIAMGRAALIAAGMPRAQAMKQTGGLFNVGGHQVIFNTHLGGDHTNHLHISV